MMEPVLKPRSSNTSEKLAFWASILFLFIPLFSVAQSSNSALTPLRKLPNADAYKAIEIEDSIAGPYNVSIDKGRFFEYQAKGNMIETHSAWYKFTADSDTLITFDIVPFDSLDDYDFVLFKCKFDNCVDSTGKFKLIKVRSCWSICRSKSGMTGLSQYVSTTDISSGEGPAYVSGVSVKAGEMLYLMVNFPYRYESNQNRPRGYKIYFYNYYPRPKPIVLNNIYFETSKSVLKKESFPELDKLVTILKKSEMIIEVRGHTDNVGREEKNLLLSQERAKAVADYLISKQINPQRVFYKGYGSSRPIAPNSTESGRLKNRRVEFVKVVY